MPYDKNQSSGVFMKFSKIAKVSITLFLASLSFQTNASWQVATGIGPNREDAVNDAIHNLLMQTGADIRLEQTYKSGVLSGNSYGPGSGNIIKKIVILESQSTLNRTTVKIKAFIDDKKAKVKCTGSTVNKSILPLSFKYADSQSFQGALGIEDVNKELDKMLYDQLTNSATFNTRPVLRLNVINDNGKNVPNKTKLDNLKAISTQYGSQYIITGTINSMSKSKVGNNVITNMLFIPTRTIDFDVEVFDAINQQIIFHKNYSGETDWPFDSNEFIDLRSDRFRGSDYGQRLYDLTSSAAKDLVRELQCAPVSARVIDTKGDDIIINIGRDNGITKDMKFSLAQSSNMISSVGTEYEIHEDAKGLYKVTAVYPHSAKLKPVDLQNNTLNVDVDDIVTLE
jgi:hypothetical protein